MRRRTTGGVRRSQIFTKRDWIYTVRIRPKNHILCIGKRVQIKYGHLVEEIENNGPEKITVYVLTCMSIYIHVSLEIHLLEGWNVLSFFLLCHDLIRNIVKRRKKFWCDGIFNVLFYFLKRKERKEFLYSSELLLAWDLSDKTIIWSLLLLWLMVHIKGSNGRWRYGNAFMWLFLLYTPSTSTYYTFFVMSKM